MIEVRNISKTYQLHDNRKVQALDEVSFEVHKGEVFGIIGSSGAGKSTLLRCLNLLERPDQGEIWIGGKEFTKLSENSLQQERRHIGMIFQHFNLLSSRTIFENVALPLELSHTKKSEIHARVNELLDLVGLSEKANDFPTSLSGGQKQRVAIARALANHPKLLLCDEATSALDPETTKSILKLLQTINSKLQLTIVLITHEIGVIKDICDRVAVVKDGRIIELGDKEQIFANPTHIHTEQFVLSAVQAELPLQGQMLLKQTNDLPSDVIIRLHNRSAKTVDFEEIALAYRVQITLINGKMEQIGAVHLSSFVLRLSGENIHLAIDAFKNNYLKTEVLGYVPTNY